MNLEEITYDPTNPNAIIDLINYNFDQLAGAGYGPQGISGASGNPGVQGVQGSFGNTGSSGGTGSQGATGPVGNEEWARWDVNNYSGNPLGSYIIVPNPGSNTIDNTTVCVDYLPNTNAQITLNRHLTNFESNLRLTLPSENSFFDITLDNGLIEMDFKEVANGGESHIELRGDEITFLDSVNSNDIYLTANSSYTTFNKNVIIDKTIDIHSGPIVSTYDTVNGVPSQPNVNDLLISTDEAGTLGWVGPSILGTNVAVGTIVPILKQDLNSTNFEMTHVSQTTHYTGRGINDYAGWYVCHGYTWYRDSSVNFYYKTPKFANDYAWYLNLKGGAGIDMVNDTLAFFSSYVDTIETSESTETLTRRVHRNTYYGGGDHGEIRVVQNSHIVYLGEDDLVWNYVDTMAGTFMCKSFAQYIDKPLSPTPTNLENNFKGLSSNLDVVVQSSCMLRQEETTNSGTITTVKPIYNGNGILAKPGWYCSNYVGSPVDYGYWDGVDWTFSSVLT
jgi:hypothetical protein